MDKAIRKERAKARTREAGFGYMLIAPYVIVFLFFSVVPIVAGIVISFMRYNPYTPDTNTFIGFGNFVAIFDPDNPISVTFWKSFLTLFAFDFVLVPVMTVVQIALAYIINLHPPGYKIFRAIIYMPCIVSVSILGIVFGNMFTGTESGLINAILGKTIRWMGGTPWKDDFLRWMVMFIATMWWQTGGNFVIFSGAMQSIPKSLLEACEMDGGGRFRKIFSVVVPHMKGTVAICLFNTIIAYLGIYGQPFVFAEVENADIMVTPMLFIQNFVSNFNYVRQTGYICACSAVFAIITMIFGFVERAATSEHPLRSKHSKHCSSYMADKAFYDAEISALLSAKEGKNEITQTSN